MCFFSFSSLTSFTAFASQHQQPEPGDSRHSPYEHSTDSRAGRLARSSNALIFSPPLAYERSPEFSLGYHLEDDGSGQTNRMNAAIGVRLPLFFWGNDKCLLSSSCWQLALDVGTWSRLRRYKVLFPVDSIDYYFGMPLMWRLGAVAAEISISHISSHLGDRAKRERLNYSREQVMARISLDQSRGVMVLRSYLMAGQLLHGKPKNIPTGMAGLGFEAEAPHLLLLQNNIGVPFCALDITWNADVGARGLTTVERTFLMGLILPTFGKPTSSYYPAGPAGSNLVSRFYFRIHYGSDRRGQHFGEPIKSAELVYSMRYQ